MICGSGLVSGLVISFIIGSQRASCRAEVVAASYRWRRAPGGRRYRYRPHRCSWCFRRWRRTAWPAASRHLRAARPNRAGRNRCRPEYRAGRRHPGRAARSPALGRCSPAAGARTSRPGVVEEHARAGAEQKCVGLALSQLGIVGAGDQVERAIAIQIAPGHAVGRRESRPAAAGGQSGRVAKVAPVAGARRRDR